MHLALITEATGTSLRLATHETLDPKSSAIELMRNSDLYCAPPLVLWMCIAM